MPEFNVEDRVKTLTPRWHDKVYWHKSGTVKSLTRDGEVALVEFDSGMTRSIHVADLIRIQTTEFETKEMT